MRLFRQTKRKVWLGVVERVSVALRELNAVLRRACGKMRLVFAREWPVAPAVRPLNGDVMVIAYHVIITNYGFWLPNDPRGSWSNFVRSWEIFLAAGPATKTDTRQSVAGAAHNFQQRQNAKNALVRPPVIFNGRQAQAIAVGFARFAARSQCPILACSIMPRHCHLVLDRPPYLIEKAANLLKGAATAELSRRGFHPFANNPYCVCQQQPP
jgi:hypothetical protein